MRLEADEVRVLGCLVEKAHTTPEHYPLTTNSLLAACNQKTNRDPVVNYDERTVVEAMLSLRSAGLARTVTGSGRTEKHRHVLDEALHLDDAQQAVFAVLLLRGAQTPGELRTRTERYVGFDSVSEVEAVLAALADRDDPLAANLGRGPGQSQDRWQPTVGVSELDSPPDQGKPASATQGAGSGGGAPAAVSTGSAASSEPSLAERVAQLEARVQALEELFD